MAIQGYSLASAFTHRMLHTATVTFQTVLPPKYARFLQALKQANHRLEVSPLLDRQIAILTNSLSNQFWREMPVSAQRTDELKPYRRAIQGYSLASVFTHRMLHIATIALQTVLPTNYARFLQSLKQANHGLNVSDLLDRQIAILTNSLSNQFWCEMPVSAQRADELKPYCRAISQVTQDTFKKYCDNSNSILEVGSGLFPITELLPDWPKALKSRIDLSDISDNSLQFLKEHYPQTNIQKFDVLSGKPTERTYERVVMTDVLNVFSRDQLEIALKNISNILCPEGILIHFSIRETFYNHVLDEFIGSGKLFFPIFGASWKEAYMIRKSDLEDLTSKLTEEYFCLKEILTEYLSLSSTERLNFCTERLANNDIQIFQEIIDCLEKFSFSNLQKISFEEDYQSRLKRIAQASGFTMLEFQEKEAYFIGSRSEIHHRYQDINLFAIDRLLRRMEYLDQGFSPELVQEKSRMHVMVAQKPFAAKT